MNDDQYAPQGIHPERDVPALAFSIRVFNSNSLIITKRLLCMSKAHLMLQKVC